MIIPLKIMINKDINEYLQTCAMIKRAAQLTVTGDLEVEESGGKIVSTAIKQVLDKKVEYRIEE